MSKKSDIMTIKKQVLDSFSCATKTTSLTTILIPFSKIVFCQYHPILQEPKKNLNLQGHFHMPNFLGNLNPIID
jgi:hypothetical protein